MDDQVRGFRPSRRVVFFDLRTPDVARSRAFYTELADLEVTDLEAGPDQTVPLFTAGGVPWGGCTALPEGDPRPPVLGS